MDKAPTTPLLDTKARVMVDADVGDAGGKVGRMNELDLRISISSSDEEGKTNSLFRFAVSVVGC